MELDNKLVAAVGAVKVFLAAMGDSPGIDKRSLAVARTNFETAFLWAANATGESIFFNG